MIYFDHNIDDLKIQGFLEPANWIAVNVHNKNNYTMPLSFDNLRVGHYYKLINYSEITEFEVIDIGNNGDYKIKDLTTLDKYYLNDLIKFGKGKDYNLYEI